jgi:predicted outer membrane repeat protein
VLNALDNGAGSLRAAITSAKSGDTIVFAPSLDGETITLTSDELAIKKNLDIEGPGASLLTISGNDANRVFDVSQGLTVTIAGLTISHGLGTGNLQDNSQGGGGGGAILNGGSTVNLANDVFASNQAEHGGAITSVQGSVLPG